MPLNKDEQSIKPPSEIIKLEDGDVLIIQSNVFDLTTHYLQSIKKGVLCGGEKCYFCNQDIRQRKEFFYYGKVNDQVGIIRLPASVFYSLNAQERALQKSGKMQNKEKRDFEWIIGKTGSGMETEYSVTRGDNLERMDDAELEANNEKLVKFGERYEQKLANQGAEIISQDTSEPQ